MRFFAINWIYYKPWNYSTIIYSNVFNEILDKNVTLGIYVPPGLVQDWESRLESSVGRNENIEI